MTWAKPIWAFSVEDTPCPCSQFVPPAFSKGFSFSLLIITLRPCWSCTVKNPPVKYCIIYTYIKYLIWYTGFFVRTLETFYSSLDLFLCFFFHHSSFLTAWFASAFYLPHFLLIITWRITFIGHFCLFTGHKHTFNTSVISPKVLYFPCNPQTIFLLVVTFSLSWFAFDFKKKHY